MAQLYEIPRDDCNPELTGSLARSFKEGLILPAERKFELLEKEMTALREHLAAGTETLDLRMNEHFQRLDTEMAALKKLFRLTASLSLVSLAGIITTLLVLFNWY